MPRLIVCAALGLLLAVPLSAAGLIGLNSPVLVDTNGDGVPDAGDQQIVPTYDGATNMMTIPNPWEMPGNAQLNVFSLSVLDGSGHFLTMSRTNKNEVQTGFVDGVTPDGRAYHVDVTMTPVITPPAGKNHSIKGSASGGGGILDTDDDGLFDTIQATGPFGTVNIPLTFFDSDGDGYGDYVSIPWAQASVLGVNTSDGIPDPQVFIPMANVVNPSGPPDTVGLDLDGNGLPDPQFLMSPVFGPVAVAGNIPVPAVSTVGLVALALGLAAIALLRLRGTLGLGA